MRHQTTGTHNLLVNIESLNIYTIENYNHQQKVNITPTKEKILDLILVNNPTTANQVNTLTPLGLGDPLSTRKAIKHTRNVNKTIRYTVKKYQHIDKTH